MERGWEIKYFWNMERNFNQTHYILFFILPTGVATQIKQIQPKALCIHCQGHCTNLACCECLKKIILLRNSLGTSNEALKLIKDSPKRTAMLKSIKKEDLDTSAGVSSFSETRWTVRAKSLNSIKSN